MGQPAAMYLVACVVNQFPTADIFDGVFAKKHKKNVHKFEKHKFNEYCVAAAGVCGSPCGFYSNAGLQYCQEMDPINNPAYSRFPSTICSGPFVMTMMLQHDNYIDSDDTGVASGVIYRLNFTPLVDGKYFPRALYGIHDDLVRNWWF